jgi:hypothetical protein
MSQQPDIVPIIAKIVPKLPPVSTTQAANLPPFSKDTGGKFCHHFC